MLLLNDPVRHNTTKRLPSLSNFDMKLYSW